ncbi:MAG: septal ring lytic transglycosylase RlpA family protein [Actinomycetota bacterium]
MRLVAVTMLALSVALVALTPATAEDLATLRARAQKVASVLSDLERDLAGLEERSESLDSKIAVASRELGRAELERSEAERAISEATDTYVDRAVAAYKNGPHSDLDLLLSAETLTDAISAAEVSSVVAEADTEAIEDLLAVKAAVEATQQTIDDQKQALLETKAEAEAVRAEIAGAVDDRRSVLEYLSDQIEDLEVQARAAAAQAAETNGIDVGQALLDLLGPSGPSAGIPGDFVGTGVTFEGIASWYGPGFEGNLTANGDVFDPDLFTAASKTLPLGTWLYVEFDGRGVVVLVNDRGPYVGDRVLDLSRAAAEAIGISGLGWVKAEILIKK